MRFSLAILTLLAATAASPQEPTPGQAMRQAVDRLLPLLAERQLAQLRLPFNDEARLTWSYLPGERRGLVMKGLGEEQQQAVLAVVRTGLSTSGFATVETIRSLDEVLRRLGQGAHRDSEFYYLACFGEPSDETPWAVRFEGHHVSLNWTISDGKVIASTPQFFGANPGEVRDGDHLVGTRALATEEDLGRSFVQSLNEEQRSQAVLEGAAPAEILTRMDPLAERLEDTGIAFGALTPDQQGVLISLVEHYARVQAPPLADTRLKKVRDNGLDTIKFTWMGSLEPGQGHYYRVQGPSFLIEYDNTQNNANHIHTVWRDFSGDFGRDLLREHYQQQARNAGHGHDR